MNTVIDSSGWIEYATQGALFEKFNKIISSEVNRPLYSPTIVFYEVYKRVKQIAGEEKALETIGFIAEHATIIELTANLAMSAADLSIEKKLAMADSIVLASALQFNAKIFTSDSDFAGIKNVEVIK